MADHEINSGSKNQYGNKGYAIVVTLAFGALVSGAQAKIQGVVSGFGDLKKDGYLDGAFVFPTLSPDTILSLDIQRLLAPSEQMSAGPTTVDVPGNLFFPRQIENYVIPMTIRKESFTAIPEGIGAPEYFALSFKAHFKKSIDRARAKAPWWEMLEDFSLQKIGLIEKDSGRTDVVLQHPLTPQSRFQWTRPARQPNEQDIVFGFQKSPEAKWFLSHLESSKQSGGQLAQTSSRLGADAKALFVRVNNDKENIPQAFLAKLVSHRIGDTIEVNGMPTSNFQGSRSDRLLKWNAQTLDGWVGVFAQSEKKQLFQTQIQVGLSLGFSQFSFGLKGIVGWYRADLQEVEIPSQYSNQSLLVVYANTQGRPVQPENSEEFFEAIRELSGIYFK